MTFPAKRYIPRKMGDFADASAVLELNTDTHLIVMKIGD